MEGIPSKHARFGIKSFESCEHNMVMYGILLLALGRISFLTRA
jgi:hypothetical protein